MRGDIKYGDRRRLGGRTLLRLAGLYAAAIFLVILAAVSALAAWRMYERMARASEGEAAAKALLTGIERQQAQLTENLERLSTPQGAEGELRRRYGYGKPGEGVIQIVAAPPAGAEVSSEAQTGLLIRMWQAIVPW